ncbi:hypothetical protein KY289_034533 [Solanum tuberosum]|nr:hypothetical protein KY289_034533 [Solanum tuberosum]
MADVPTDDRFRPPDPTTGMNMHDIHKNHTRIDLRLILQLLAGEKRGDPHCSSGTGRQETQKSHDFNVPSARNLQATAAKNVELVTGVCTTGRGGHPTEVSGNFHGGITDKDNSGESTKVPVNLLQNEDMQSLSKTQNPHRAGKEKVQELGQSSSSHLDDFVKKQGKETGTIPIDNSRSSVIPAYNSGTELHRTENHPSKEWVAKEQDHSTVLRQGQGNQGRAYNRTDHQQDYHSNFTRISSNFDRQAKSDVSITLTAPEITTKQGLPAVLYVKEEIVKDLASACKYTLIGKFSTTMPKVDLIRNNFILQTQLSRGVKIAHFNSRHVYIDLDNEIDYNMVWTKQRMTISGKVMRIQVWTPSFKHAEETSIVPIWISLPKLPWHCYNKEFVTGLLSPIGKVLYLDSASIKKTRGSQPRVKVQVDLTHKRPPYIWMGYIGEDITDGRWQKIEYENIPDYCFYCKHQGHVENDCTIRQRDEEKRKKEIDNVRNKNNKDMDNNQQQPKGYKESGPKDDPTNLYNQQRDQGQKQGQQEDQWQTQRRRNNNQQQVTRGNTKLPDQSTRHAGMIATPTQNTYINLDVQESPPPLEELDIHNGSKQDSRLQPVANQQQGQGEQIRHVTKNTDNISGKEVIKGQVVTGID